MSARTPKLSFSLSVSFSLFLSLMASDWKSYTFVSLVVQIGFFCQPLETVVFTVVSS